MTKAEALAKAVVLANEAEKETRKVQGRQSDGANQLKAAVLASLANAWAAIAAETA